MQESPRAEHESWTASHGVFPLSGITSAQLGGVPASSCPQTWLVREEDSQTAGPRAVLALWLYWLLFNGPVTKPEGSWVGGFP